MPFYKIRLRDQYGRLRDVFLDAADMKAAKDKAEGQADRKETLTMTRIRLAAREEYLTVIQAPNDELPPVRLHTPRFSHPMDWMRPPYP